MQETKCETWEIIGRHIGYYRVGGYKYRFRRLGNLHIME